MIGSISLPITKSKIKQMPDNNIISDYFRYDYGSYVIDTTILPGRGYWVKVNNPGNLILNPNLQPLPPSQYNVQEPPLAPGVPGKPRLLSPDSGSVNQAVSLTFSWYQVDGATSYRFQLSTSSIFSTLVVDDASITTNSKTITSLSYSTTYYWRVKAANANGYGNWSNVWRFTTTTAPPTPPPAPVLLSPSNGSTGKEIALYLSWNPASTATSYRLQVSRYSNFNPLIINYPNLTETSEWISSLSYSTKYYWRVNASNSHGTSDWSSVWNFTTKSAPPPNPCLEYTAYPQMDAIVVSDSLGNRQTLYMRNRGFSVVHGISGNEEMPPEPPPGLFHARFSSGKFLESIPPGQGKKILPLHIRDAVYPLTISWNIKDANATNYRLHVPGAGKPQEILMVGTGSTIVYKQNNGNNVIHIESESSQPCDPMETKSARVESDESVLSSSPTPKEFALLPNIPNPFNPTTVIRYELPEDVHVTLKVYDVLGQEIVTLANEMQSAGYKSVTFDGTTLSAGVYFYQLKAGSFSNTNKLLLVK